MLRRLRSETGKVQCHTIVDMEAEYGSNVPPRLLKAILPPLGVLVYSLILVQDRRVYVYTYSSQDMTPSLSL
jgi:hypothetical protein